MLRTLTERASRTPAWRQWMPRCAQPECASAGGWTSLLYRGAGFYLNHDAWYCCTECLEAALLDAVFPSFQNRPAPVRTTMPMGLMLLSRGLITNDQLRQALEAHHATGEPIGSCLAALSCVTEADITSVVATQWGCPVFPADSVHPACARLLPFTLAERYRMLPVHLTAGGKRLFVAFCNRVNHSALMAVERMLGCETDACVISELRFKQALEQRKQNTQGEVAVNRPCSPYEVASMIRSYALQTGAGRIQLQTVEGNIWARFRLRSSHLDLVFEHPPADAAKVLCDPRRYSL